MRRWIVLLAAGLCLVVAACGKGQSVNEADMQQPVRFYYCQTGDETTYSSPSGALGWELRDLGQDRMTVGEIVKLYLKGPKAAELRTPFPKGLQVRESVLQNGVLTLVLSEEIDGVTGIERSLAAACLVHTLTQFSDIEAVQLECAAAKSQVLFGQPLTQEDFLLLDDTDTSDATVVKLYFPDSSGRYLVEEVRSEVFESEAEVPEYVLQQLIAGPREEEHQSTLPAQTHLLYLRLNDGVCTVNLSLEFVRNAPQTQLQARLTVLSVVNSLTELPQVESVRFLCAGESIREYAGLDLSKPLYRDISAVCLTADEDDYDATLYLPCGGKLAALPGMLHRTSGRRLEVDVLNELISYEAVNCYENPIPDGVMVMDVQTAGGLCSVTFNGAFALCDTDAERAELAVRSVVATLCALEDIDRVQITVHNGKLTNVDLSEPLSVEPQWILP